MNHEPALFWTRRNGCWSVCLCGWRSLRWTSVTGAHLEFGTHLLEAS